MKPNYSFQKRQKELEKKKKKAEKLARKAAGTELPGDADSVDANDAATDGVSTDALPGDTQAQASSDELVKT
jgi:hypothetical protein